MGAGSPFEHGDAVPFALRRDVTEDSNFRKTRFLATMSHEMRTPLNGILGMANRNRMGKGPLTPCQTQQLKTLTCPS